MFLGIRVECVVGFLPPNTMAVTIVYILLVPHNEDTFMILCNAFLSLPPPPPQSVSVSHVLQHILFHIV
jgi:hypothetical protein